MRVSRAFTLPLSFLVGYAIDSTKAMELFHDGQEVAELSRTQVASKTSAIDLHGINQFNCLHRRGLAAGRLSLRRRCQTPLAEGFEHAHQSPHADKPPDSGLNTGRDKPAPPPDKFVETDPGFEMGITRFFRAVKEAFAKMKNVFNRDKVPRPVNDESVPVLAEKGTQIPVGPPKTVTQKIYGGLLRFFNVITKDRAPDGVLLASGKKGAIPHWAVAKYTVPWKEMEKSVPEMQAGLRSMTLEALSTQMHSSQDSEIAGLGSKLLANPTEAGSEIIRWAGNVLSHLPQPDAPMQDLMREKLVVSVKALYVYANGPSESLNTERARFFLGIENKAYNNDPSRAGQGIAKYIGAASKLVDYKPKLPPVDPKIQAKLVYVNREELYQTLKSRVEQGLEMPKDIDSIIDLSKQSIEDAKHRFTATHPIAEETLAEIDKNADWGLQTLFYLFLHDNDHAAETIELLYQEWMRAEAHISSGFGKELVTAHNLIKQAKSADWMAKTQRIAIANRLAKLQPTDWLGQFAKSSSPQVKQEFYKMIQVSQHTKSPYELFKDVIIWAGKKIDPLEQTTRHNQNDIILALETLFTHAWSEDEATAQLARSQLTQAMAHTSEEHDAVTTALTKQTYNIITKAERRPSWVGFKEALEDKTEPVLAYPVPPSAEPLSPSSSSSRAE